MKTRKLHYGWIVIFMGMLTTIAAHGFGRMSYTVILPSMKTALDLTYTQMGWLGTGNFVGYLTMAIIGGFLAARFGTRIVITIALILMGATLILTGLAQSFGFAFAMRLLTGLGNGASYVPVGLVCHAAQGVCHRNCLGRHRNRHDAFRLRGSTGIKYVWSGRLALFMVYSGRGGDPDCRDCVPVCA
jgi:hypothetical protein